jgi:hypothetical protein
VGRDQFNELCKTVFFRTEDYPTSTAVIVHGTLNNLLGEFELSEKDLALRQQYGEWAQLCRTNLDISIANLSILLPAGMESAQALLMAVSSFFTTTHFLRPVIDFSLGNLLYGNCSSYGKHNPLFPAKPAKLLSGMLMNIM